MIKTLNIKMLLYHANYLWHISSTFYTYKLKKLLLLLSQSTFIADSHILRIYDEKAVSRRISLSYIFNAQHFSNLQRDVCPILFCYDLL